MAGVSGEGGIVGGLPPRAPQLAAGAMTGASRCSTRGGRARSGEGEREGEGEGEGESGEAHR